MNALKQRKMLILFLIYDNESQFTAHIIYDLINDQSFLFENEKLSEVLFNSLHWKIQKIFKVSETNFENQKKKLENININDIPYESKILSLKAPENIKAKAIEKLKEINGSKENSIKAQQWLDGFLKIPFGVYKKEKIIDFFGSYQKKVECFVNSLALKLSDFDIMYLDSKNQEIYNHFNEIINEYYSYNSKSEHTFNKFNDLLTSIYFIVKNDLLLNYDDLFSHISKNKESEDYLSIENQLLINENNLNDFKNELDNFKKIKY